MISLADIRNYALALPDVVEKPHFRLPGFRVADKLLAHLEKGGSHAIVCVGQAEARAAAADEQEVYQEVWRDGRIFVGLIGNPEVMRLATQHGLPRPLLMKFTLKLLANLRDPRGGDALDRVINGLSRLAPAA